MVKKMLSDTHTHDKNQLALNSVKLSRPTEAESVTGLLVKSLTGIWAR